MTKTRVVVTMTMEQQSDMAKLKSAQCADFTRMFRMFMQTLVQNRAGFAFERELGYFCFRFLRARSTPTELSRTREEPGFVGFIDCAACLIDRLAIIQPARFATPVGLCSCMLRKP
jgi:hypothetical protein